MEPFTTKSEKNEGKSEKNEGKSEIIVCTFAYIK